MGQQPRLPRRLCEFAAFALGGADRLRARAGAATTCSATPGTARCARPTIWPRLRRWAATLPSARLSRLRARKVATAEVPVLFESTVAAGLIGALVQATSGGALYRKSTFLLDSLGRKCWPRTSTCTKTRVLRGRAAPLRRRRRGHALARRGQRRRAAGLLPVELLGAQARHAHHRARRRLAEPAPGQPAHPERRRPRCDAEEARPRPVRHRADGAGREPGHGRLLAGAAGFWVEGGRIVHPVHEVTIAGICATCSRASSPSVPMPMRAGAKTTGSILVERMKLAGQLSPGA